MTTTARRAIPGVTVHTTRALPPDDVVLDADGLPRTSWARTVAARRMVRPSDRG